MWGNVVVEQGQVGATGDRHAAVRHFPAVPVKTSAVHADFLLDHGDFAGTVRDGHDLRIDLRDDAKSAHALQIRGIGALQVGDGLTVLHLPVLISLALLENVHGFADGAVALSVQGEAEALLVGR